MRAPAKHAGPLLCMSEGSMNPGVETASVVWNLVGMARIELATFSL